MMFIDPHVSENDPKRVCFSRNLDNIEDFKESLLNILGGTFGFTKETLQTGYFKGTVFWFPLRFKSTELSDNVYGDGKMEDLFKAFRAEASHMMLFLKSLSRIEVYQKNAKLFDKSVPHQDMGLLFTVDITDGNDEDVNIIRHDFASSIKELTDRLPPEPIEKDYYLKLETEDFMTEGDPVKKSTTWLVIQHYEGKQISKAFRKLCYDETISSCPCVGLAVALEEDLQGHIFCFLPLPLESRSPTGLPVHVHGHFALSQNRRHLKWPTADQKKNRAQTDRAIRWNQYLLLEVFPQTYAGLILQLVKYWEANGKNEMMISRIYHTFPVISQVTDHWEGLCKAFYKLLFGQKFLYTPNCDGMWIEIHDAILLTCSSEMCQLAKETLVYVYQASEENIVEVPDHLQEALMTYYPDPDKPDISELTFVTPKGLCNTLKSKDLYTQLTGPQKLALLEYICSGECFQWLEGVNLLPLADGSFTSFAQTEPVYICQNNDDTKMFPGLENKFIHTSDSTRAFFDSMAEEGIFSIEKLTPETFCVLLKRSLEVSFHARRAHITPASPFCMEWLSSVWQYITEHEIDVQKELSDAPIIPGDEDENEKIDLYPVSSSFICMTVKTVGQLDKSLGFALKHLGIIPLSKVPDAVSRNTSVLGKIIQYPSLGGLQKVLEDVAQKDSLLIMVTNFNQCAVLDEKLSLIDFLKDYKSINQTAQSVLKQLQLFASTESETDRELNMSVNQLHLLEPKQPLPVSYPSVYLRRLSEASLKVCKLLGAQQMSLNDVICDTLKLMKSGDKRYVQDDVKTFMKFLIEGQEEFFKDTRTLKLASEIRFLTTEGNNERFRARDLFEPVQDLCKLFLKEDVFPATEYLQPSLKTGLKTLGLLTISDIKEEHLCNTGDCIEKLLDENEFDVAVTKGQALLGYLKQNIKKLNIKYLKALRYVKFVPCIIQKPGNYPETLRLLGEEKQCVLERLENVWNAKYINILGSVSLLAKNLSEGIMKAFNLPFEPPFDQVLEHLETAVESYREEHEASFRTIITDLYMHLSKVKLKTMSRACHEKLENIKYVWVSPDLGFQLAKNIWIKKSKSDIDLKPYRFCLPKLLNQIEGVVTATGGQQSQTSEMLVDVLGEIKKKHDKAMDENRDLTDDLQEDLRVIFQIINTLKLERQKPKGILLPIHQDENSKTLVLKAVRDCTYCNADWLKDQTMSEPDDEDEVDALYFVHGNISEDTALKFGVTSLTDRVMDGTESIDLNFGQVEPLTQRLHNILQGYSSYSIPKEIIQNAEDAGASKVMFLYDERQNSDARTSLMNEAMASLQGPALWVYNDAQFTEDDFRNIQKLGGATKMEDESKIGRYGLGFNSVYNMTDVPSFISGNTIVIFDPHQTYLGKPGLKADLTSIRNRRMLQTMKGQFKPFDGVFGCQIDRKAKTGTDICKGTLFRLPLRTPEQAENSKITDASYTKAEMKSFLKDIAKGAGNLLLFTHHVQSIDIYHLQSGATVDNCHLLLTVEKTREEQLTASNCKLSRMDPHVNPLTYLQHQSKYVNVSVNEHVIEKSQVVLKTTPEFCESFSIHVQNNKTNWQITWTMGMTNSNTFVRSAAVRGLIPLASSAVPLQNNGEVCKIGKLSECPEGFYVDGHLFSFLPLPVPSTQFNMHINAQFALTDDRRHLCDQTEEPSVPGAWNKFLETDVISRMMVLTLVGLKGVSRYDTNAYYQLWPHIRYRMTTKDEDCIVKPDIVKYFYRVISQEEHKVFPQNDSDDFVAFNDAIFLAPNLAYNEQVGKIAVNIFQKMWNEGVAIDLPKDIFQGFMSAGLQEDLKTHVLDRKTFYQRVFLPNIGSKLISLEDQCTLTIHALNLYDSDLDDLLKSHKCIPTKPKGELKSPEELVHPTGKMSKLFSVEDGKFPDDTFSSKDVLDRLCSLGMKDDELPWQSIIERLYTVPNLYKNDEREANKRSLYIVQYLSEYDANHKGKRYCQCTDAIRGQMRDISFLPVLPKPSDWPFTWMGGNERLLSKPEEIFFEDTLDIVGCFHQVIDSRSLGGLFSEKDVLKWLGVQEKNNIPASLAKDQLLHISAQIVEGISVTEESTWIINALYRHLDDLCKGETDSFKECQEIVSMLHDDPVILHDKTLVCPHQVAFHLGYDLKPHLYQLDYTFRNSFRKLFQAMGIEEKFTTVRVKREIDSIAESLQHERMTDRDVQLYIHMVTLWLELSKDTCVIEDHISQMMLPDSANVLKPAQTLCLDDCNWISDDSAMQFVHSSISREVALKLRVKTKIHANIETLITPLTFGQTEKLTNRLKGILEGYPRDSSIMKELLQNADDAGATELMFIMDFRTHPTERIFDDKWKPLQGPALCVWNNKGFRDKDFEGIQDLGKGSKSDDPLKTGQYGVGFNAVYHLTDVPSFLTFGPDHDTPETLCIFDPNLKYVPWATPVSPGCMFQALADVQRDYRDVFGCYLKDVFDMGKEGTLFRLPLRTQEMAIISEISKISVPIEGGNGIRQLLKEFQNEMTDSLLFLHNVRTISIHTVTNEGNIIEDFKVTAEINEESGQNVEESQPHLDTQGKQAYPEEVTNNELKLTISDSNGRKRQWLVVHQSGFSDYDDVPVMIKTCMDKNDGRIGMLPRGGVAVPLDEKPGFKGKVFCFLPLRIFTGLPVHINGHFALDHEARGNLWHGPHPYRTLWNESIIKQVIVHAFVRALGILTRTLFVSQHTFEKAYKSLEAYNDFFPVISKGSDEYWKLLGVSVYEHIVHFNLALFPVLMPKEGRFSDLPKERTRQEFARIEWVTPSEECQNYFQHREQSDSSYNHLVEILKDLGLKIIDMPLTIYCQFEETGLQDKVFCLSPKCVLKFLKTHSCKIGMKCQIGNLPTDITSTALKDIHSLVVLTKYCQSGDKSFFTGELDSLPLLLTQDSKLRCFDSRFPSIVTHLTDLVRDSPEKAMHLRLVYLYTDFTETASVIQRLDIQTFSEILSEAKACLNKNVPISWNNQEGPSQQWILKVWNFLKDEIQLVTQGKILDVDTINQHLVSLKTWCILPVVVRKEAQYFQYLYPIQEADKVLDLKSKHSMTAFSNIAIPQLDTEVFQESESLNIARKLVPNLQSPNATLKAVAHSLKQGMTIDDDSAKKILIYFCTNLRSLKERNTSEASVTLLKSLPIFEDMSGSKTNIRVSQIYGIRKYERIPQEGMEQWSGGLGITMLKCTEMFEELFTFLGIKMITPEELYTTFILKKFANLPKSARVIHLTYVRDCLLQKYYPQQRLSDCLKSLSFIEDKEGSLHRACEYFCKQQVLFLKFCSEEKFAPPPYDSTEWGDFLELAGIVTDVSEEHFVQFAKKVEQDSGTPLTKETKEKSILLVQHLFQHRTGLTTGKLLSTVKVIRFVVPHQMEKDQQQREMTKQIHPQFQQGKLICYSGSVSPDHCDYVWTSCAMFEHHADPDYFKFKHNSRDRQKIAMLLGVLKEPQLQIIVDHASNVCTTLQQKQQSTTFKDISVLQPIILKVMDAIYKQLYEKRKQLDERQQKKLKSLAIVFLPEEGLFVRAEQIVLEMSSDKLIKGYMYKAPVHFGPYFDLFLLLGAAQKVTANHYATILQTMAEKTDDTKLDPNELQQVKTTTELFFSCVTEEKEQDKSTLTVPCLYLLDSDQKLAVSTQLVIADNQIIQKRLKSLKLRYFVGFRKLKISATNEQEVFGVLPSKYKPTILTQATRETITEDSRQCAHQGSLSEKYKSHISHQDFLEGFIRLINDQRRLANKKALEEVQMREIEEKVASLDIKEVEDLKTVISYNGVVVKESKDTSVCFLDTTQDPLRVYLNATAKLSSLNKIILPKWLALAINKLTGLHLSTYLSHLERMFECSLNKIKKYLDKMMIAASSYISSHAGDTVFPDPGTRIPVEYHWMLDNSISTFEVNEYVGLEIYDPLTDESLQDEDQALPSPRGNPVYIYAKVKKLTTEGKLAIHARYLIDVGESEDKEVSALDLYKFCRIEKPSSQEVVLYTRSESDNGANASAGEEEKAVPSDDTPLDMETVLKEIRETLKEAWKMPDKKYREKVKKRLLFKWHPDKNKGNTEFCTKVFQRIQNYIDMLDRGKNIDEDNGSDTGPKSRSNFHEWFYEEMNRRSRQHRDDYEHQRKSNFDFEDFFSGSKDYSFRSHRSAREDPHPQPDEARRWMRQAREDLQMARITLENGSGFNWSCFQCYMACEKAVKAVLYNRDGKEGDQYRTQDLPILLYKVKDAEMLSLLHNLLGIVQTANKMQYPTKLDFPTIPAEKFTAANAEESCHITDGVLQKAGDIIG